MLVKLESATTTHRLHESILAGFAQFRPTANNIIASGQAVDLTGVMNLKDENQRFPLHFAVKAQTSEQSVKIAEFILKHGGNPNAGDSNSHTPLHFAASKPGYAALVTAIVVAGGNPNQGDLDGFTAFHAACHSGDVKILQAMYQTTNRQNGDNEGRNPLHYAVMGQNIENITFLLNDILPYMYNPDENTLKGNNLGITPLHLAAELNNPYIIRLFQGKCDPNQGCPNAITALHMASTGGHIDAVTALLEIGANPNQGNKTGCSPVHIASAAGNNHILKLFSQKGFDLSFGDSKGVTPLHTACLNGHLNSAYFLIKYKNEIANQKDKKNCTPFDEACASNNKALVAMMLDQGAKVTAKSLQKSFASDIAVTHLILSQDAVASEEDVIAAAKKDVETTTLLLRSGGAATEAVLQAITSMENAQDIIELVLSYGAPITQNVLDGSKAEYKEYLQANVGQIFNPIYQIPETVDLLGLYQDLLDPTLV
jgi:ankyrin repeat protein